MSKQSNGCGLVKELAEDPEKHRCFYVPYVIKYYEYLSLLEKSPDCLANLDEPSRERVTANLKRFESQGTSMLGWYMDMSKFGFSDINLVKEAFRRLVDEDLTWNAIGYTIREYLERLSTKEREEGLSALCSELVRRGNICKLEIVIKETGIKPEFNPQDVQQGYANLKYISPIHFYELIGLKPDRSQTIRFFKEKVSIGKVCILETSFLEEALEIFSTFIDQDPEEIRILQHAIKTKETDDFNLLLSTLYKDSKGREILRKWSGRQLGEDEIERRGAQAEDQLLMNFLREKPSAEEIFMNVIEQYE